MYKKLNNHNIMHTKFQITLIFIFFYSFFINGQDVRVAVIGDFGAATLGAPHINNEAAVADLVKSWDTPNEALDAIITVGDNNYPDGLSADIETNIGQFYGEYIKGHSSFLGGDNRFFPSIGNHDYGTHNCNETGNPWPYKNYFELPGNELYYDYVIGNAHFFVVDSDCHQTDGVNAWSTQAQWLETQMTNSPHPWKIVYFHHAPYSSTNAGDSGYLQWDFKEWGATAIISGHYHIYERLQVDGLTYFVNGIGGNSLHEFTDVLPYSQVRYNQKHGATLITFSGNEANFKTLNIDHEVIDDYTIINDNITSTNNGDCNTISGHTKLGEWNDKSYFLSNENSNWEDAQSKSVALGGHLVAIESQEEKDFLDPFISGNNGEQVIYTGLKRNNDVLEWTSGEAFNINNYSGTPWEPGTDSSTGNYGTIRKWNPNSDANWGMESGSAYRKYIVEKTCEADCSNQGGDTDGDGICDNEDCQPTNPSLPSPIGAACNDNNANTTNDVIQSDGCTCLGEVDNASNNTCNEITDFTKLGEFNGKGYYRSNFNGKGWEDAQVQCLLQDGYLVALETQAEKDYLDQNITGTEDKVMYIGLSRNELGILKWTSGSFLDINNFNSSPWEGGMNPSSEKYTTLRRWNPDIPVEWGTEAGNANRKFIMEKTCALDCTNQGGDTDGDGVCDSQDCSPNDANFPAPSGTTCDDGNPNTSNDIIAEDGCTCSGTPILVSLLCDELILEPKPGKITVKNITTPIAIIKIYNADWDKVFECNANCGTEISKSNLPPGIYHIDIQLFTEGWVQICNRNEYVNLFFNAFSINNNNEVLEQQTKMKVSDLEINTYPNPTQNKLFLSFLDKKERSVNEILIYDSSGKIVQQHIYNSTFQKDFILNTERLEDGIYLVQIEIDGRNPVSKRFVVKK